MAVLIVATLRRVAPAQTLPRGERGPRLATDLQPRPVPQSYPAGSGIGSSGIPCSAYTRKYPIPGTRRGPYTVGQQCVKNTVENIVRIKPVNIVNRYTILYSLLYSGQHFHPSQLSAAHCRPP